MSEIILEIEGKPYVGFTSATASKSMEDISGEFTFNISAVGDLKKFPIKNRSSARVLVNGIPFISGYVEKVVISYDHINHQIAISGRDKTCDVIDNTIGSELSFTAGVSLQNIIKKTLALYGLDGHIGVSSNVEIDVFDKNELGNISSQIGETAFDFIEKYAKKRQVLIMSDGNGNIVLARASKNKINTVLTSSTSNQSTILNADITYDDTKRFYKYVMITQKNSVSEGAIEDVSDINHDNEKIVTAKATAYDKDIRTSRVYNLIQHDDSYTKQQDLQDRAQWESNYRMAKGFTYKATVQGFSPISDPNIIWQPNLLVLVNDEFCDIPNQLMLIKSVSFKYGLDSGSTTTLELIDKDGYSLDVLQGVKYTKHKGNSAGKNVNSVVSDLSPYRNK